MRSHIDLNADVGEGLGPWRAGDDAVLLEAVTSAPSDGGIVATVPSEFPKTSKSVCWLA